MTNEEHELFLSKLDESIGVMATQDVLDSNESNLTFCINVFTDMKYGEKLPIVWVKSKTHGVNEFYSSELNLPWLLTYIRYYGELTSGDKTTELDVYETYRGCLYMSIVMTMCKGVNIIDGIVYILMDEVEFVSYKMDRKLFI